STARTRPLAACPCESLVWWMHVPIRLLVDSVVLEPHGNEASLGFADDADKTGEVEVPVLAAQADARHLHREVVLPHSRDMLPPADRVRHTIAVAAFQIVDQLGPGVPQRLLQPLL